MMLSGYAFDKQKHASSTIGLSPLNSKAWRQTTTALSDGTPHPFTGRAVPLSLGPLDLSSRCACAGLVEARYVIQQ